MQEQNHLKYGWRLRKQLLVNSELGGERRGNDLDRWVQRARPSSRQPGRQLNAHSIGEMGMDINISKISVPYTIYLVSWAIHLTLLCFTLLNQFSHLTFIHHWEEWKTSHFSYLAAWGPLPPCMVRKFMTHLREQMVTGGLHPVKAAVAKTAIRQKLAKM